MATRHYDFVVLGGGNSGLNAAHVVANGGRRVAVIDPGPIGGLCNLGGCKPKKILVRATEVLDTEPTGKVKLVFDADSRKLLGTHLYGAEAGENIHVFAMAVGLGLRRNQLAELAFACPTRASGLLCMLQQYRGQGLTPH